MKLFEATNVTKQIDRVSVLKEISFVINHGERLAITGHNGSGKSSLLKLIGGIYEPSSGQVERKTLTTGYVPEHFPENIRFRLMEYLLTVGKMSGKREEVLKDKILKYADDFHINDFMNTPLKSCSKGTKQKAGIIQALLLEPELLLLDEPMTGLDEKTQNALIKQLSLLSSKTTSIFTVHDSILIDGLANRVITMGNGRIIEDRAIDNKEEYRVITAVADKKMISNIPFVRVDSITDTTIEMTVLADQSDRVLSLLLNQGCSILELREKR